MIDELNRLADVVAGDRPTAVESDIADALRGAAEEIEQLRFEATKQIVVTVTPTGLYKAQLGGGIWKYELGESAAEAIGRLIVLRSESCGIHLSLDFKLPKVETSPVDEAAGMTS